CLAPREASQFRCFIAVKSKNGSTISREGFGLPSSIRMDTPDGFNMSAQLLPRSVNSKFSKSLVSNDLWVTGIRNPREHSYFWMRIIVWGLYANKDDYSGSRLKMSQV